MFSARRLPAAMSEAISAVLTRPAVLVAASGLSSALVLLLVLQILGYTRTSLVLDPSRIVATQGAGYLYPLGLSFSLFVQNDTPSRPDVSDLVLKEDGVTLAHPHSRHDEIAALGGGRYSHWHEVIYFAASDGSDPRSNGRTYEIEFSCLVSVWVPIGSLMLLSLAAGARFRPKPVQGSPFRLTRADIPPIACLSLVALSLVTLLLQSVAWPVILQSTDAGNIAGWVAGSLYPDRLAGDFLVSNPQNTSFYVSVVMPVVRLLGRLCDNVGLGYLLTVIPILVVQLPGFYLLGRCLTRSRAFATLLSLLTLSPIWVWGGNDLFGLYVLPLVRNSADAALPWLLLLFLSFGNRAALIPILFAACGVAIYLHPVSAPAIAAGLWVGCLSQGQAPETTARRLVFMILGGVVFVLTATPFAFSFFASFSGGEDIGGTMREANEAFRRSAGPVYYDAWLALSKFVRETGMMAWPVWYLGLAGLILGPFFEPALKRPCRFLLLFLVGVLLSSVGVCAIDQTIARFLHRTPFQLDLIRGLRLVIPILLIGFVIFLAVLQRRLVASRKSSWMDGLPACLAIVIAAQWWTIFPNRLSDAVGLSSIPEDFRHQPPDATAMLGYLRARPVDGSILPIGDPVVGLAVRYSAVQPLAFLYNDINALFYSGSDRRLLWTELATLRQRMAEQGDADAADALVSQSNARYLLMEDGAIPDSARQRLLSSSRLVKQVGRWSLVERTSQAGIPGP